MYHLPAEWAPQSAVQLTFPHQDTDWAPVLDAVLPCFVSIAAAIARFEPVLIVCRDKAATSALFDAATAQKIIFVETPSNDTWARDHGGITMLNEQNKPLILDFVFNGWGLKFPADKDNLITGQLHQKGILHGAYRHGGIVLEGGGIESDGKGSLLTTAACMFSPNRNPHLNEQEVEDYLKKVFAVERVLWLRHGYLAGDDTDSHIDTLARFCDENTIAYVRCDRPEDEHYAALSAMERELQQFTTKEGRPYQLIPLPWPDACYDEDGHRLPATYANFLIINGAVLVPVYGVKQDGEALNIIKEIFPDREVIGIDCRVLIEQHGSLHCVTMQYPEGVVM